MALPYEIAYAITVRILNIINRFKIMKRFTKTLATLLCILVSVLMLLTGCNGNDNPTGNSSGGSTGTGELVDYASQLTLDFTSETKKQEVTVRLYIDGDTTHFDPVTNSKITPYNASDFADTDGYIKARYLAVNTPENTGTIEEWGQKASDFVEERLKTAQSIVVESDDNNWNIDSSGSKRYTVWIWYLPKDATEYKNLNVEILQAGLARGSSTANNRYGTIAMKALNQARDNKLYVFSTDKDPEFPYGTATPVTLKELRCRIKDYAGKKIRVEGVVTAEYDGTVYIEDYDKETDVHFGITVYYGYKTGKILEILSIGNRVSVCGVIKEFQGTYQISGVSYDEYSPESPSNSTIVSENNPLPFTEVNPSDIVTNKNLSVYFEKEVDDKIETETVTLAYAEAIMSTTVTVKELTVIDTYTTQTGNSAGAMSLTCKTADGNEIVIRTEVLKDENNKVITTDKYAGKKITVKGIVDKYETEYNEQHGKSPYQIKVYRADYITILG